MSLTIPLLTVSELNSHEHWRKRQKRAKAQRQLTHTFLAVEYGQKPSPLPLTVLLTRLAPRQLDSDNLQGALKHVRDGVADWLGIDDRDPHVTWEYAQHAGKVREYGVEITLTQQGVPHA